MVKLVIRKEKGQAQYYTESLAPGIGLKMTLIPGGTFQMGSPETELERNESEGPQHLVTVPSFFMGCYPITQVQWRIVAEWEPVEQKLDANPAHFNDREDSEYRPVEQVTWYDAKEFCARLSLKTNRDYGLPTEAEWEYACRAGSTTPFNYGETIATELANYNGNYTYGDGVKGEYRGETTPVGYFEFANAFGLYDMHGNVFEWCEDDYHKSYEDAPTDGSAWRSSDEDTTKVTRGGSWYFRPLYCRCASRGYYNPDEDYDTFGLRVVCTAPRNL
ncbi:MAG: formylglycine-generating enzyme family protein [Symploca sp. SIO1C4]|uniref:Formylglycine-generating enzyme family protein n=1 Tax=Symploca sp. SIO1C4 TaxID=2607765 RepID=A0A6B3N7Q4_9CYAN|nr:formylglycine-generating enzyme family protein [Symploca sp. SIO1C4]